MRSENRVLRIPVKLVDIHGKGGGGRKSMVMNEIPANAIWLRLFELICNIHYFFPVALRPNAGHGLLILEASRSHTATHHSR